MPSGYQELLSCGNGPIADAAMKCESVFATHEKAYVAISGGADSDVMLDLCERVRQEQPIKLHYEFTDTGIEYKATKDHLAYLEDRYGVTIRIAPPDRTIPWCCKNHGLPFVSKMVSHQISKLQGGGFQWDDEPLEILRLRYPKVPVSSLKWWTDEYYKGHGSYNSYCIGRNKWLKEFIVENPPQMRISEKCCTYVKKNPGFRSARVRSCDVVMMGVRRAEGGIRSASNKCFTKKDGFDFYRPLYFLTNADRAFYDERFDMVHSDCYSWGFTRTGCVGCPFNRNVFAELDIAREHEPGVVRAAETIFKDSFEYTRQYQEYCRERIGR